MKKLDTMRSINLEKSPEVGLTLKYEENDYKKYYNSLLFKYTME